MVGVIRPIHLLLPALHSEHRPPLLPYFILAILLVTDTLLPWDKSYSSDLLSCWLWPLGWAQPIRLGFHVFISSVLRTGTRQASRRGKRTRGCHPVFHQHIQPGVPCSPCGCVPAHGSMEAPSHLAAQTTLPAPLAQMSFLYRSNSRQVTQKHAGFPGPLFPVTLWVSHESAGVNSERPS